MYVAAKLLQAVGLTVIAIGFMTAFPELMNARMYTAGAVLFLIGWIIERYLLKR